MRKNFQHVILVLTIVSLMLVNGQSQVIAGFEDFNLKAGKHLNNAFPQKGFQSGSIELPNYYDEEFDFWSGWAISADTNTTTPGFLNQFSVISGGGALGTTAYAIGYIYDPITVRLKSNAIGKPMIGMYVNNSTYAYLSMRDGDPFSKKFGGETGSDPDFLLLTIKKYSGGAIDDDSINLYLADYRFPQSQRDYIVSEWTYIDLTTLGEVDSLVLRLTSSDVGVFGMNTPAYVCIDQVSTDNLLSASSLDQRGQEIVAGPNPVRETLYITAAVKGLYTLTSSLGTVLWSKRLEPGLHEVSVSEYPQGTYFLTQDGRFATKVSIQ